MKTQINMILGAITILMTLFIANCGSNSGGTSAATPAIGSSCGTNMLQSQFGCNAACGTASVIAPTTGVCTPITSAGVNTSGYYGNTNICSTGCSAGAVNVNGSCLPQGSCNACYGYYGGYCYEGAYAPQFYGTY